jgi:hypothetical protein
MKTCKRCGHTYPERAAGFYNLCNDCDAIEKRNDIKALIAWFAFIFFFIIITLPTSMIFHIDLGNLVDLTLISIPASFAFYGIIGIVRKRIPLGSPSWAGAPTELVFALLALITIKVVVSKKEFPKRAGSATGIIAVIMSMLFIVAGMAISIVMYRNIDFSLWGAV